MIIDLLPNQRSRFRRRVIDFNLEHWILHKQFLRRFLCSGITFELCLEMAIDDKCETICGRNVSALNISGLLLLDLKSRFLDHLKLCHLISFL
jgi:hypothetical protein